MKAVICPVCNGSGKACIVSPSCHGCDGLGWVAVEEDCSYRVVQPNTLGYHVDIDECPYCGSDRSSAPTTGCPQGSHYGTYCNITFT